MKFYEYYNFGQIVYNYFSNKYINQFNFFYDNLILEIIVLDADILSCDIEDKIIY